MYYNKINEYGSYSVSRNTRIVNIDLYSFAVNTLEPLCQKYFPMALWKCAHQPCKVKAVKSKPNQEYHRAAFSVELKSYERPQDPPEKYKVLCKIYNENNIKDVITIDILSIIDRFYRLYGTIINGVCYFIELSEIHRYMQSATKFEISKDAKFLYVSADYFIDHSSYYIEMEDTDKQFYNKQFNKYIKTNKLNEDLFDNPDLDYDYDIVDLVKRDKVNHVINQKINDIISGKLDKKEAIEFMSNPNNIGIYPVNDNNIEGIIKNCINCYGYDINLNWLDTSQVTDMSSMFAFSKFNGDISLWDVSSVTDMSNMFDHSEFTGDISNWDVSSVKNMYCMFAFSKFNGDISLWDVGSVTNISWMFYYSVFDGDISKWDVSSVTDMSYMFAWSEFNGDISLWDVSNVTNMSYMFYYSVFDGDISKWDVSSVTDMSSMFAFSKFNGDISLWDVSSVTDMSNMFDHSEFTGDISNWDVSSVKNMYCMFLCSKFNGDISLWNVSSVTNMRNIFYVSPLKNQRKKQPKNIYK